MKPVLFTLTLTTLFAISPTAIAALNAASAPNAITVAPELKSADQLFVLLDNRAAMMRAVAIVKWRNGGAIEDLRREEQVVQNSKTSAQREGLSDVTATSRAQIRLAKLIQIRWHERWARAGLAGNEYSIPLKTLRARLDIVDAQILSSLRQALPTLRDQSSRARLKTVFLRRFRVGDLRDAERLSLFDALLLVRQTPRDDK